MPDEMADGETEATSDCWLAMGRYIALLTLEQAFAMKS